MKIEVRFRGLQASNALREHIARRARFQLSRFNGEIGSVVVRIGDINGPKGGADKRCHVTVCGPSIGPVVIADVHADAYSATDMALERVARTLGRELQRTRTRRSEARSLRSRSPLSRTVRGL